MYVEVYNVTQHNVVGVYDSNSVVKIIVQLIITND